MMSRAVAARSSCGTRLHLQHGPIDLVIKVDGDRDAAFAAAANRFATILDELVVELPLLRAPLRDQSPRPMGPVARRMDDAARRFVDRGFLTRMIAVAGSVADEVLAAMRSAARLDRAMVNNGGDIALHLAPHQQYRVRMKSVLGDDLGDVVIRAEDGIGGIATSGRHGRSFSLGIADSVTVLAENGALADAAATLIANAVDLPGHARIRRAPACSLAPDSDLGSIAVVTDCGNLAAAEKQRALARGQVVAEAFLVQGRIHGAALFLQGNALTVGTANRPMREIEYA